MRIEKIIFKNYRGYRDVVLPLIKKGEHDLHIFISEKNSIGKTNLINAINWCLYGDEPHCSVKSQRLPILNLITLNESSEGQEQKIIVEIEAKTDDDKPITFQREATFVVNKKPDYPTLKSVLKIIIQDTDGNTLIIEDKETNEYVERFLPYKIREYFFFDGEKLEKYFDETTGQNLKNNVITISRIETLTTIEDRLDIISHDYRKAIGKLNPNAENTEKQIAEKENERTTIKSKIENKKTQIDIAQRTVDKINKDLQGIPDIHDLQTKREKLVEQGNEKTRLKNDKIKKKEDILLKYAIIIRVWPAIEYTINIIKEKREQNEIPLKIEEATLEKILAEKICVCGRPLDHDAESTLKNLKVEISQMSMIGNELLKMEGPLDAYRESLKNFENEIDDISKEIDSYERDIENIIEDINQIDKNCEGYDKESISNKIKQRRDQEDIIKEESKNIGYLEKKVEDINKDINDLNNQLNNETAKETQFKKLNMKKKFCDDALALLKVVKEKILNETREKIENETKTIFFDLIWKKQTYRDLEIDENYNLKLISMEGYPCLGTAAASERQLVAFAFMLALHKVSGFDAPIFIDTPVGRVSDIQREKFGEALIKSSLKKQLILLFTRAEYSDDIKKVLDGVGSKMIMKLKPNEKEVEINVINE